MWGGEGRDGRGGGWPRTSVWTRHHQQQTPARHRLVMFKVRFWTTSRTHSSPLHFIHLLKFRSLLKYHLFWGSPGGMWLFQPLNLSNTELKITFESYMSEKIFALLLLHHGISNFLRLLFVFVDRRVSGSVFPDWGHFSPNPHYQPPPQSLLICPTPETYLPGHLKTYITRNNQVPTLSRSLL